MPHLDRQSDSLFSRKQLASFLLPKLADVKEHVAFKSLDLNTLFSSEFKRLDLFALVAPISLAKGLLLSILCRSVVVHHLPVEVSLRTIVVWIEGLSHLTPMLLCPSLIVALSLSVPFALPLIRLLDICSSVLHILSILGVLRRGTLIEATSG